MHEDDALTESAQPTDGDDERDDRGAPPPAVRPASVPPDALVRTFRVPPEMAGMRVDVFLSSQLRNTSRTRAKLIAEKGVFSLEGRKLRASDRLRAEDRIAVWRPPIEEADAPLALPTLYEDEHLLVIDKPAPMAVHPTARHHHVTVIKLLRAARPGQFLSLIHRLDRETSGVLLVAKSRDAERAFKRLIEDRSVALASRDVSTTEPIGKTYLAITWGVPQAGLVQMPLEPDTDSPLRVKMRVAPRGGLDARTEIAVRAKCPGYALVECQLHTGRQHQIRVHLSAVGCPIVGDKLYGPDDRLLARAADGELSGNDQRLLELPRQALHAHRYTLSHAITGRHLDLRSPLPTDLEAFWLAKTTPQCRAPDA